MKKSTLILFLLILTKQLFSQVAIFIDFSISENKVILFGPQNVSRYFDEQAASYILKYKEFETIIKSELAAIAQDLEKQESKKIRNLTQIGKLEQEIGHYYLKLELLTEFISAWESHQDSYLRFKNDFSSIFNGDSCYCFEHGGLELCTDEITIEKSDSNADLNYDQFIKDEMKTIVLRLKPGVEPIKKPEIPAILIDS